MPPSAFWRSTRACAPFAISADSEAAGPVSDVITPIVMVDGDTPGALAVGVAPLVEADVEPVVPAVVGEAEPEPFELELHAAASTAVVAITTEILSRACTI